MCSDAHASCGPKLEMAWQEQLRGRMLAPPLSHYEEVLQLFMIETLLNKEIHMLLD
jgi:hypothetical protein